MLELIIFFTIIVIVGKVVDVFFSELYDEDED